MFSLREKLKEIKQLQRALALREPSNNYPERVTNNSAAA
jgi:hypothetical protein